LIEEGKTQNVVFENRRFLRRRQRRRATIRANGKLLGPLGPHGSGRDVEFKNGAFRVIPITEQAASKEASTN